MGVFAPVQELDVSGPVQLVTAAFRHLAQDIDRLPMPKAEWEREERTDTIFWLMLSQRPTHVKNAVKLYRDMQLAEESVRDEVLRGN